MVVMCAGLLYRVPPWLCVLDFYTGYNLGCYVCLTLIQGTALVVRCASPFSKVQPWLLCVFGLHTGATLVVMSTGLLYRVQLWLICVLDVYAGHNLDCYVCWTFIQGTTLVVMCVGHSYRIPLLIVISAGPLYLAQP